MAMKEIRIQQKNTDWQRVIVFGDVLALPYEFWCMGGFGTSIEVNWLLRNGKLPGSLDKRKELAAILVQALDLAHGHKAIVDGVTK